MDIPKPVKRSIRKRKRSIRKRKRSVRKRKRSVRKRKRSVRKRKRSVRKRKRSVRKLRSRRRSFGGVSMSKPFKKDLNTKIDKVFKTHLKNYNLDDIGTYAPPSKAMNESNLEFSKKQNYLFEAHTKIASDLIDLYNKYGQPNTFKTNNNFIKWKEIMTLNPELKKEDQMPESNELILFNLQ